MTTEYDLSRKINRATTIESVSDSDVLPMVDTSKNEPKKTSVGAIKASEFDYIDFDITASSDTKVGRIRWNSTDRCVEYDSFINGEIVTNQIGQEIWIRVRNNSGSEIGNGKAVYVNGAIGNRPTIALAQANAEATSLTNIGITTQSIDNNQDGFVSITGSVRMLNTNAWNEGDLLYLSETTAGELTNVRPSAPNFIVALGIVTVKNPSVGEVGVLPRYLPTIDRLSLVNIVNKANGDVLRWDSSNGYWENASPGALELRVDAGAADYNPSSLTSDSIITANNTVAARAITISTEDVQSGSATYPRQFVVKDEYGNATTNALTITLENGGTIDGQASYVLNTNYESITLYSTGTNAFIK